MSLQDDHRDNVARPEATSERADIEAPEEPARTAADVRDHLSEILEDCFWENPIVAEIDSFPGDAGLILEMEGRRFLVSVQELPETDVD